MHTRQSQNPIEAAARIVEDDKAGWSKVRWASWRLFQADQFEAAQRGFERLVATGHGDVDVVTALQQLYSDRGEPGNAAALVDRYLGERGADLTLQERLDWLTARFDAVTADSSVPERSAEALQLLEAAAACGPGGWSVVLEPDRRAVIEATMQVPTVALSAFEQYMYAPAETGLPAEAVARLEALGCRQPDDWDLSRSAERLLHAVGEPEAAYRVEACRRAAMRHATAATTSAEPEPELPLRGMVVTIAGGHPALRSLARRDLKAIGVRSVREIPSAWEATRVGRSVQATLAGSDVIVVIARQIAHTTSDQVRGAATRLGLAVVTAETASVASIRRAVERFAVPTGAC
ncbi:MAG: hypothetical protein QOF33_2376 [Thermomicrobiales bacterium]|nr:hypothetical protein [Thermomicrobiales bacterium]